MAEGDWTKLYPRKDVERWAHSLRHPPAAPSPRRDWLVTAVWVGIIVSAIAWGVLLWETVHG